MGCALIRKQRPFWVLICVSVLMFSLFLLVGCSNVQYDNNLQDNDVMEDICITEIERYSIDWNQIQLPIDLNENVLNAIEPIDTNQKAVEIGTNIIEEIHRNGMLSEHTLISITHSIEDNIWCFEYSIDQRDVDVEDFVECGGTYLAVDGSRGVLMKAWAEE